MISSSESQSQRSSPPKALLIDLDGTVLPPSDQPTTPVIEAIKAASQLIPVGVASGRVQHEVGHYARMFGLTGPQVADNGATLLDPVTGRSLISHSLNRRDAELVISILQPEATRLLVCDEGRMVFDPAEISHWNISVIIAEIPTHEEAAIWADRLKSDSVNAVVSLGNLDDWYVNCTKSGVDKGAGARDFSRAVGVDLADLMVIGDGWNDLPMFRVAGHAVAMQGAPDKLLALATAIVPNVENDGAAKAIEQYVLNA